MLGRSVIDVDVGPKAPFKDGFFVVILEKNNKKDCEDKSRLSQMPNSRHVNMMYGMQRSLLSSRGRDKPYIQIHISEIDSEIDI